MVTKRLSISAALLALAIPGVAAATDLRLGVAVGYGGAGITKTVTVNGTDTPVQKSEGPGTFALYLDYLLDESFSAGLEHSRGFRIGPFSSGVSFTGIAGRWYLGAPIPTVGRLPAQAQGATILVKRFTPFIGGAAGIATGDITRENDEVADVSSSGAYVGIKLGADYPLAPGIGFRPEIVYSTTLVGTGKLLEGGIQFGLYLFL